MKDHGPWEVNELSRALYEAMGDARPVCCRCRAKSFFTGIARDLERNGYRLYFECCGTLLDVFIERCVLENLKNPRDVQALIPAVLHTPIPPSPIETKMRPDPGPSRKEELESLWDSM